ncbi:MAG: AbrB/MazE/SpoVT family DNA-binding domain-containing protein [Bryobacteraceae bacterium]
MATGTLTSKGQITIPKSVRDLLRLHAGHRVEFQVNASGQVLLKACNKDIRDLKGIARPARNLRVSLRDMDKAIAEAAAGR